MTGKGIKFALFGLALGLFLGFGLKHLKTWGAGELIGILEDEVSASCDCKLVYDSVDISLLALTATAVNVRLVSQGEPRLTFEKVHALFSLSRVLEKRVILSELQLINGFSNGVGPDSPTFMLIDHLTAPIPPERDRPGRWRLLLQALRLKNTGFVEDFPRSRLQLVGVGGNFLMRRNADDDFKMHPTLDRLEVRPLDQSRKFSPILLGRIECDVTIKDETIDFERVRLMLEDTWAQIDAVSQTKLDNLLSGNLTYSIDSKSIGIEPDFRGRINGTAELGGSLGNPKYTSSIASGPPDERVQYWNGDLLVLDLDTMQGKYDFDLNHGRSLATMYELSGEGPNTSLALAEPLKLDDGELTSAFRVAIGSLDIGNVTAEGIQATVRVEGPVDDPKVSVAGDAARLMIGGVPITPFEFTAEEEGERIKLDVTDADNGQGDFAAQGYLARLQNGEWGIEKVALTFERFTYMPAIPTEAQPDWIHLTGTAEITGPLDIGLVDLHGSMDTELFNGVVVSGPLTVSGGALTYTAHNESNSVHSDLRIDLLDRSASRMQLRAEDLRFSEFDEAMDCLQASFTADYSFRTDAMLAGDGTVAMHGMAVGCPPYSLILQPADLRIRSGSVETGSLRWQGMNSEVRAQGSVSLLAGYDLALEGSLPLSSLLPLLPSIDDLGGTLTAELRIDGPLGSPVLDGHAALTRAEVVLEAADLDASNINGQIVFRDGLLQLDSLNGDLNNGKFEATGTLNPFKFEESSFELTVSDVVIEPASDSSIVMGGQLTLDRLKTEKPSIHGEIRIESGEFEKNIGFVTILRAIRNYIFASERTVIPSASMPNINLDVGIVAPRNLLITTNWLAAELKADLHVGGTIASPLLQGQLETLSGWFGIKDRRFDITSGRVIFRPGSFDPQIEIIGEATIRTAAGDSNLVIVEISGLLSAPRTKLTSDSALSDKEILDLITIGTTSSGGTFGSSTLQDSTGIQEFPLIQEGSLLTYNEFLRNLTRIDSLAVGPSFNSQTGGIEPSVVARKNITRRLSLVGESSFGGTETESGLGAVYDISSALKLSAGAESSSAKQNTAFEVDLTYTVLAPQLRFLEIGVDGTETFDREDLLEAIRLSENSRVPTSEIERLGETVEKYYASEGFVDAKARVECSERGGFCRSIHISVQEGQPRYIRDIAFEGDDITDVIERSRIPDASENERASQKYLTDIEAGLVQALRSEGYIGARARGRYEIVPDTRYADLIFDVHLGKPVSFTFRGNREFGAEEFLETINLFSRNQPFGPNTINILLENIERLYREKGYLFVTIHNDRIEDPSGRVNHIITIQEEQRTPVSEVRIEGGDEVVARRIRRRLAQRYASEVQEILAPEYAVEEKINQNALLMREILLEEGYPEATVEHSIEVSETGKTVNIAYLFELGEPFRAARIELEGIPEDLDLEPLEPPYSIPKINRHLDAIRSHLKGAGFLRPEIVTYFDAETTALTIRARPGSLTYISGVVLEGNVITNDSIIRRNLTFAVGNPWAETQLEQTRRKLLRLGLFSRVEIRPLDGELDEEQEELLIKLSERPLRTLDVGTGANSEYGLHVFTEGTDKKLFGDGKSLSLKLDGYYDPQDSEVSQGLAALRYLNPYFFSSRFSHTEDLRFQRISTTTQEFDVDRISLASYLYRTLEGGRTFSFGHTASQENLDNVPDDAVLSDLDTGVLNLSYISGRFDLDRRDAPLNPSSGYNLNLEYKLASDALGSEASFHAAGGRFSYWLPLPIHRDRFYLANSTRVAAALTLGDTEEIPITQRYYLGGRTTLRGFRENDLGPKGEEGSVLGGDTLFSNNFELRYRLGDSFEIHSFLDIGNVFLRDRSLSGDDLRFSTGIGARYLSPIGPIGFDVGGPLDEKEGEPSIRFHFSVGAPF